MSNIKPKWEEELDKTFINIETGKVNYIFTHVDIKNFIQSPLDAQKEKIIESIKSKVNKLG